MADNETSIALPERTGEAEAALAGAVQATQAADQHIEPGVGPATTSDVAASQAEPTLPVGGDKTPRPEGSIISTQ
ncbi:hypothetical protein [Kitasatospora acidiphila]|uniref:hypothetical protein n=1 Tax=Kitasatospora acidiphila TaxID=2567942 RepID=UPI003C75C9BC